MRHVIMKGDGVNHKTGRSISFEIPSGMSERGQDALIRNVGVTSLAHVSLESDEKLVKRIVLGTFSK